MSRTKTSVEPDFHAEPEAPGKFGTVMRRLFFSCILLGLLGCAAERAVLINDQGEQLTCETSGAGFFGSVSVHNQQAKCIADAEKRGYRLK
jgi:hypothetical protein